MQTQRLRSLICPTSIEQLLDSYILSSRLVSPGASKERDPVRMPLQLRDIARRASADGWVWAIWCDEFDAWLFTASFSLERSRELGRPVLEIRRHELHEPHPSSIIAARLPDGAWCEYSE